MRNTFCSEFHTLLEECEGHPRPGHADTVGNYRCTSTLSLISALDGVDGERQAPAALPSANRHATHRTGGRVDHRTGLDGCVKSRPPQPGIDPGTVQLLVSRYTD